MVLEKSTYLARKLLSPLPCEAGVVHHWLKHTQGAGEKEIQISQFLISTQETPFSSSMEALSQVLIKLGPSVLR